MSRSADLVGRVLGDRYRLTRPLGTGASAHVYVAEDVTLRRLVAIKVLHPALAGDDAFGRRFRAEAQVVAALRHPNILRVYDWGEDDGSPFLVMELLEGGSLRSLLDRGQLLSPAQAAAVGADAARALDYAHRRSLVHRDIKPANLIFDDEGRLTVADFGLARALAEASWTEPAGAVVGTARYAAPEQVRGQVLDHRADVYALGLVLIEATTGEVPFASDTSMGTLMARLDHPVRVPDALGPLAPVLEAATTTSPEDRLDADGLARALAGVAAQLPPPAPLPLAGPLTTGGIEGDVTTTEIPGGASAIWRQPFDIESVEGPGGAGAIWRQPFDIESVEGPGAPGAPGAGATTSFVPEPPAEHGQPRRRRWLRRALVVLAVTVLLAGGTAGALVATGLATPSQPVPALRGKSQAVAAGILARLHLRLLVTGHSYSSTAGVGTVIGQEPTGGRLKEGSPVTVTLSLGPQPVPVPSLVKLAESDAASVLETLGLKVGPITKAASMDVPAGAVISATPSGGTLLPGQSVALEISTGKPTVAVPVLAGPASSSFAAAQSALRGVGLGAVEQDLFSDSVAKGAVVSTTPPAGSTVTVGATVTVVISKGPDLVAVPQLAPDSVVQAAQILAGLGFEVSGVTGNPTAAVTATNPAAGALAHRGAAVQIITS